MIQLFRNHFDEEDRGLFLDVRSALDMPHQRALTDRMMKLAEQLADETDVVDRVYESGSSPPH